MRGKQPGGVQTYRPGILGDAFPRKGNNKSLNKFTDVYRERAQPRGRPDRGGRGQETGCP